MRTILFGILLLALGHSLFAQESTTVETYDLIYMRDNRGILKGEIILFDEFDGHIVFVDTEGRKYTIRQDEYDYFIEDKVFVVEEGDTLTIYPRKENEFEYAIGFLGSYMNVGQNVKPDANFIGMSIGYGYLGLGLKASAGKFIGRQHYVGLTGDIQILGEANNSFNAGLRYMYQGVGIKSNVAFYIPIEIQYGLFSGTTDYRTTDTNFVDGGYEYPSRKDINYTLHSIGIHAGFGLGFMLPQKRALRFELTLVQPFIIGQAYPEEKSELPEETFKQLGFRLGMLYAF